MKPPPMPENLRAVLADGAEIPLDLAYRGIDREGIHIWETVRPVPAGAVSFRASKLPARTGVHIVFPDDANEEIAS